MQNNYNQWQNQTFQGGGQMSGYSYSNPNQNAIQVNEENNASGYQQQNDSSQGEMLSAAAIAEKISKIWIEPVSHNAPPMPPMSIIDFESPERIGYEPNLNVLYYKVVGIKGEPSPRIKDRAICNGRPIKIEYLKYDERYNREEDAVVTWLTACGKEKKVTCPKNKLSSKTFIDCLVNSGATQMHGSDSAMRNAARIVAYINDPNQGVDAKMWIVPYNAGWVNRRNYIAYSAKPNNLNSGINRNLLLDDCYRDEKSAVYDIIRRLEVFRDESNGIILLAYLVSAFLRPFYKECGYELKSILLTPDNSSEMSKVLSAFLKIYNTNTDSIDTISNQRELTNILYNHKDDVVILNETSVREDGINKVYGFLTDTVKTGKYRRNEHEYEIETTIAMIGYRIRYKIKENVFITLPIEDEDIDTERLNITDTKDIPTFIRNFSNYIINNSVNFGGRLNENHSYACRKYENGKIRRLYAILSTSLDIVSEYFKTVTGKDLSELCKTEEDVKKVIENFSDFNAEYDEMNAADDFKQMFINMVKKGSCSIIDPTTGKVIKKATTEKFAKVYIKRWNVYISKEDVCEYLCGNKYKKQIMKVFLSELKDIGRLRANEGYYRKLEIKEGDDSKRKRLICIDKDFFGKLFDDMTTNGGKDYIRPYEGKMKVEVSDENEEKMYLALDADGIANRQILITGVSGSGKTIGAANIVQEYLRKSVSVITIDLTDSLRPDTIPGKFYKDNADKINIISVYKDGMGINILKRKNILADGNTETETIEDVAERTADIFKEKFHLGSKQYYTLKDAICVVLNQNEAATLADIGAYLTEIKEYDLRNKLDRILGKDYCGKCEIDWNEVLYGKPTLTIFQMSGLNDVKYLLAEFILMDFMRYVKQNGNEEKQCVLWADECQELKNYKHFSMHDILTTNRKFGVNALLCTQYISGNFDKSTEQDLLMAGTRLIFQPTDGEKRKMKQKFSRQISDKLMNLNPGQCLAVGKFTDMNNNLSAEKAAFIEFPNLK